MPERRPTAGRDPVMDAGRTPAHRRNPELERLLADLAADLAPCAARVHAAGGTPRRPVLLIVGAPRSGTTLLLQWLAAGGHVAYPSNLVARFAAAPWIGARVERLLTDPACDHHGELTLDRPLDPAPFTSRLGKTRGLRAPHEFWGWWRRFLPPPGETHAYPAAALAGVDTAAMNAELAAWQAAAGDRPLVLKAMHLCWNLDWLARAVPRAVLLHVRRDPVATMASLLRARRDFFGDENRWYSFRPPAYPRLRDLPPADQVAGQVHHTRAAVAAALAALPPERWLTVDYAAFCARPAALHATLRELLAGHGVTLPRRYDGPAAFPARDAVVPADRRRELERAWERAAAGKPAAAG